MLTFSLPVKQQGAWQRQTAGTPTYLSFSKAKMQSPKENDDKTNYIALAQPW